MLVNVHVGSKAEIVEGYPSLTARMVELAEIWAAAHPASGRPRELSEQGLKVKSEVRLRLRSESAPEPSGSPLAAYESKKSLCKC